MANTKVRKDEHGLYIRTNGNVYRPQETPWSYWRHDTAKGTTFFTDGQVLKVAAVSQTPFAKLRAADGSEELWHTHGMYIGKKSTDCWQPKAERHRYTTIKSPDGHEVKLAVLAEFDYELNGQTFRLYVTKDSWGEGKSVTHAKSGKRVCPLGARGSYQPGHRPEYQVLAMVALEELCKQQGHERVRAVIAAAEA